MATIALHPDNHIDELEAKVIPTGDHAISEAPVNEAHEQRAFDEALDGALPPLLIEPIELVAGQTLGGILRRRLDETASAA